MSEERLSDLVLLDPSRFEDRDYAALSWVRAFLTCPEVPEEIEKRFWSSWSPRDREHIAAAMKAMFCVNLTVNTQRHVLKGLGPSPGTVDVGACRIAPPAAEDN